MALRQHGRQYDLVVFGATGYTGKYTAEHITTSLSINLKWALAGRSREKLESLAAQLKPLNPDRQQPEIEICDLNDQDLSVLAKKTCILITTVGPYGLYGEYAFKACAENGTHYFDVTGEIPYVARMISKYENVAKQTGSMLFPQIGVESSPADLMAWSAAKHNREHFSSETGQVVMCVHRLSSVPSGGTLASVLSFFDIFTLREIAEGFKPYALSPVPNPKANPQRPSLWTILTGVRTVPHLGILTTFIGGNTDKAIVDRTWGLLSQTPSKKEEFYGPNFSFSEHIKVSNWLYGMLIHWAIGLSGFFLATIPPLRALVKKFVYAPGSGPDREDAKKDEIEYRAVATPDASNMGNQAFCRAWFNGSMYALTGIFAAEAAATLLDDDINLGGGGVFTPACLGQGWVDRLDRSGFKIETKSVSV